MGLFDYVKAPFKCPHCKKEEEEHVWQTKSLLRELKTYKVGEVLSFEDFERCLVIKEGYFEIHTVCEECEKFVSAWIEVKDCKITENISYDKKPVLKKKS